MPGVKFLEFVLVGVRLFSACIGFLLPFARAVVNHDGVAGPALDALVLVCGWCTEEASRCCS